MVRLRVRWWGRREGRVTRSVQLAVGGGANRDRSRPRMRGARRSRGTRRSRAAASRAGSARREPRRIPTVRGARERATRGERLARRRRGAGPRRDARVTAPRGRAETDGARAGNPGRGGEETGVIATGGGDARVEDLVLRDRFSAPERTPGPPAPPRARTVPRRDRDRANVPDRAAKVELLTLRARRCVAPRARRAEKREQKKRDRLFEKQNTRVCSGYWCPYTPGGASRTTGSEEGEGASADAGVAAPALALDGEEGPEVDRGHARAREGRRESERSVWRASRSEGSPGRRRVLTSKTLGGAILGAPQADDVDDTGILSNSLVVKNKPLRLEVERDIYHEALGRSLVHTKVPSGDLVQMHSPPVT